MTVMRDAIDTTTLGWIKPELDETLRQAREEIEAFAENPSDTARMRVCASHLHQVHGTLRMVELYAPAMVAEEMERLSLALLRGEAGERDEACALPTLSSESSCTHRLRSESACTISRSSASMSARMRSSWGPFFCDIRRF